MLAGAERSPRPRVSTMTNSDPIASILAAEQAAVSRVAAAREWAASHSRKAERDAEALLARVQTEAHREAEGRAQFIRAQADEQAAALREQGQEAREALRHRLARQTSEAAARITKYVLP